MTSWIITGTRWACFTLSHGTHRIRRGCGHTAEMRLKLARLARGGRLTLTIQD